MLTGSNNYYIFIVHVVKHRCKDSNPLPNDVGALPQEVLAFFRSCNKYEMIIANHKFMCGNCCSDNVCQLFCSIAAVSLFINYVLAS